MDGEVTKLSMALVPICLYCVVRWKMVLVIYSILKIDNKLKVYRDNQINNILDGI
jgi:hypothetical protein